MERGYPDAFAQNLFALGKKKYTFLQIESLFSMERLDFVFTQFLGEFCGVSSLLLQGFGGF